MRIKLIFLFLFSILFLFSLSGCTPYKKIGLMGGYSETRLRPDMLTVSFRGNAYTSKEKVDDFDLLRCAEVTIECGFRYFAVMRAGEDV